MKFINKFKSPNYNDRKSFDIKFIIIHYTALRNVEDALEYLCAKKNKVSSHFVISKKGEIYKLVNENKRAWHAGISYWDNITDINSYSLGIELDYFNNGKDKFFSMKMIKSLSDLLRYLKEKYKIKNYNILGHSDIAPFRKIDPGVFFPWKKLMKQKLVLNHSTKSNINHIAVINWFNKNRLYDNKKIVVFILSYIGYDTKKIRNKKSNYYKLIRAYQQHYVQSNITGKADKTTIKVLTNHFINLLLTKKK